MIFAFFIRLKTQHRNKTEQSEKNGVSRIPGIPFFNALNSGNFSSTTSEKSSFLKTDLGKHFEDVGNMDEF